MLRHEWKASLRVQTERISVLSVIQESPTKEMLRDELLDVIDLWFPDGPSESQLEATKRLARALREEAR